MSKCSQCYVITMYLDGNPEKNECHTMRYARKKFRRSEHDVDGN